MSRRVLAVTVVLSGLLAAAAGATALWAQQPVAERGPPKYRRIFVPEDELAPLVKGLLPVKREEFERRLAEAGKTAPSSAAGPRIARASYSARLSGQNLVDGEARFEIAVPQDGTGALSLEPCNLALGQGKWEETPPRRAVVGVGPRNVLALEVDKAGTVSLPWTRHGEELKAGSIQFDLALPETAMQELRLRLPPDLQLSAEPGLVSRISQPSAEAAGDAEWLVQPGGGRRVTLRVFDKAPASGDGNLVLVKEQARYALTPTDVACEFQWQVDVHGEALRTAQLRIDPRLQVTQVSVGGQNAAWSVAGDEKSRTLSVEFTQPLSGGNRGVSIQAICEQALGKPWRLPRMNWEGAVWQEGSAVINVPSSLQIAVTGTSACRATKTTPPAAGGESLAFQYHSAEGYVEVEAVPLLARLTAATGITIQFEATQVSATLRADLAALAGEAFEVDAVVSSEWILDAVETEPADLLEDRPVVIQDERSRTMRLKFQRPITPQQPLRLIVRARRQQPLTGELSAETLWRWFSLRGTIERPAVMSLRSNIANYDLQVSGDMDAARLDPEASSSEELSLLDAPPSGLLFRLPAEAADFRILLRAGEPRYTAAWDVSCAVSRSRLRQQATVRCIPSEPGLSRLVVSSRPPPQREIRWRVTGAADVAVVAQTRADKGPSAANPLGEAEWELELSRPLSQPFTLESNWEEPRTPRQTVPLFSSRNATSQTGVVRVTAEDDSRWSQIATQLVALPVSHDSHRFTTTRGLFRYDSGQRASLVIAAAEESALLPLARLTGGELVTQFAADGSALNVLSLSLENTGLLDLAVSLPESAALQDVAVDGRPVDPQLAGSEQGELRIPLPAEARRVAVRISYATGPQAHPLYVRTWHAELPTLNLATPAILWLVALPPGMSAVDDVGGGRLAEQLPSRFWGLFQGGLPWIRWLHPWQKHALSAADTSRQRQAASDGTVFPESTSDPGWSVVSRQAVWSPALTLEVCRPQRSALLGLALLLAGAGLVLATGRRWPAVWFLAAVGLAAVTLIVPLSAAPLAAGAFWGVASGSMAALLRPAAPPLSNHGGSRLSTTRWVAAASASSILVLAWLVVSGAIPARAAPPDSEERNKSLPAQRVVIPVGDDQKPAGDYVFVEGELYDWLLSQPQRGQPGEPWQLRSAVYDVRWPDSQAGGTQAADVRASLDIETFADDAHVTLPLKRKEVLLQSGGARLDGMPLNSSWRESGSGLICVVPTPGKYRLELAFSSPLQDAGQQRALSLSIPRSPTAVARVSHPSAAAAWTSATALGTRGTEPAAAGSSWQVDLGSAAELTIQTNVATPAALSQPAVEAEQLLWWKVRPGSVVVDAVCKFRPLTGALEEVQLRFDPSLRLFSLDDSPQFARHWVENGAASTLHVALANPTEEEVVIRPRFLLAAASGIGKIVPPRLEAVAPRISRHWMAVTPGPGLELVSTPDRASVIAEGEFVQAWGPADVLPQAAFNLAAGPGAPALELRPETRQASATVETTVICSLRLCRLRFQADLTGLAPHHMQQRVALPPGWSATQVIVRDGDLPVRSRWFQEPDGTLVARLDQPPAHSLRMQIDATLTPPSGGVLSLPAVRLLEVSDAGQTLRVLRGHDCEVQVADVAGWVAGDVSQIARHQEGLGRLVANLRGAGEADGRQLTLRVTPNRPQVTARLVTRYSRESPQGAEVVVVCDLSVSDGKLDALRLEAPAEWSGPWETSPPLSVRTVSIPGQATRHLTLIPELPLAGKAQLTIKAPLTPAAGEPVRLPDIAPLDLPRVERLVQWPKLAEGDTSKWNSSGLQAAPLPADLSGGLLADPAYETLAVVAPHFDAVLTAVAAPRVEPLVSLVEYRAAWRPPGVVAGEAIFCLDVSSLGSMLLELPPQHRLTFATLDDLPAEVVKEKEGRFRVRPSGLRLPQRLVVGFEGRSQLDQGRLVLSGPALVGPPARATIWSLAVPDSLTVVRSDLSNEGEVVQLDQDLLRLEAVAELLGRAATRDVTGISSDALAAWLRPWRADATLASRSARATLHTIVKDDGAREAAFLRVETQLDGYWQTLPGGQQPVDEPAAGAVAVSLGEHRLEGAARGTQPQVALEFVDPAASRQGQRLGAALLAVLLGVAACVLARWSAASEWLAVSGPFLLAGGGVALACLSPLGIAALAITLLAVAMAWRTPWSHPADRRHSSIVVLTRHSGSGTVR
jgi:hypothetical protein